MTIAVIGLGGNIGDPRTMMGRALDHLDTAQGIRIEAVSSLYETPPWGNTDQPAFLNAAARVDTSLTARQFLDSLLVVEAELGRTRSERWGPRTVDLDILVFGNADIREAGLYVPHPRLRERAFALLPLADVYPEATIARRTAAQWLTEVDTQGIVRLAGPDWWRQTISRGGPAQS